MRGRSHLRLHLWLLLSGGRRMMYQQVSKVDRYRTWMNLALLMTASSYSGSTREGQSSKEIVNRHTHAEMVSAGTVMVTVPVVTGTALVEV